MIRKTMAFWLLFGVTTAVYAVMVAWTLPRIAAAAGGATPFDLRPGGYSFEEASAFLAALTPAGRSFYLDVQQSFDLVYPALLSATLFFAIWLLVPPRWGAWRWILALIAVPPAVFDYLENLAVANLLKLTPGAVTPEIVGVASQWTVLKSQSTTVVIIIVLALLILWAGAKLTRAQNT